MMLEAAILITFGVSYKGYEFDWMLIFIMFISGVGLFFSYGKSAKRIVRLYLWLFPIYSVIAIISFITEPIFFIILMVPFWPFILPNEAKIQNDGYAVRGHPTIMGSAQVNLYKNYFVFEKDLGTLNLDPIEVKKWTNLHVIDSAGKVSYVRLTLDGKDSLVQLARPVNYYDRK